MAWVGHSSLPTECILQSLADLRENFCHCALTALDLIRSVVDGDGYDLLMSGNESLQPMFTQVDHFVRLDDAVLMMHEFLNKLEGAWPFSNLAEKGFTRWVWRIDSNYFTVYANPVLPGVGDFFITFGELQNVRQINCWNSS